MDVLYVVSRLLDYPDDQLAADRAELTSLVAQSSLSPVSKQRLENFMARRLATDLLDWQSDYDGLFERGRALGLWLFEHVHGESRERGQAMVDLLNEYRKAGLEPPANELPDYLPLFLEFLVTQGPENAQDWLSEVELILATLLCRLEGRGSDYADLFHVLLEVADSTVDLDSLRVALGQEKRDDTREAMDKVWEEEMVTFGAGDAQSACKTPPSGNGVSAAAGDQFVPVTWVDFKTSGPARAS